MPFKKITKEGERFMYKIGEQNGVNGLIRGKNSYDLQFTDEPEKSEIFESNILDFNNNQIINNTQYINNIIYWMNYYSKIYDLDANIISAQAFAESAYKTWNYARTSTASGLSQFILGTIYDVIVDNKYKNITPLFEEYEIDKIISNVLQPYNELSYRVSSQNTEDRERSRKNRYQIHINLMNNPDLLIKAQCRLMRYIANRNNNLASNTLFAYNRGHNYRSDTYLGIINSVINSRGREYIDEGVKYVEKIFAFLSDKENNITKNKPKGYYFGYNLDLFETFDIFDANLG